MLPMVARPFDDKPSDTLVVVSDEGFWTGSSTLPHLHQPPLLARATPWSLTSGALPGRSAVRRAREQARPQTALVSTCSDTSERTVRTAAR